jgi:putative endonuclease
MSSRVGRPGSIRFSLLRFLRWLFVRWAPSGSGGAAERLAATWLRRERGFRVVVRNWRSPRDRRHEIDLVCRDGEVLVFVEVKARTADALVPGYYTVNARKKRILRRAAQTYLARLPRRPRMYRFDIVEVELPRAPRTADGRKAQPTVRHFENVPLF